MDIQPVSKEGPAVTTPAAAAGPNTAAPAVAKPVIDEATPPVRAAENKAAGKRHWQPTVIQEGDFVVIKIHQTVRKDGQRNGKLVPKALPGI